jgi:hypothetical protein
MDISSLGRFGDLSLHPQIKMGKDPTYLNSLDKVIFISADEGVFLVTGKSLFIIPNKAIFNSLHKGIFIGQGNAIVNISG